MINKKAMEKLFSVWWFFILGVFGLSIAVGTIIFYSADADARELEANILADTLFNCAVSQGYLNEEFFNEDFDIFKKCGLKQEKIIDSGNFYFNITILDETNHNVLKEMHNGTASFDADCRIVLAGQVKGKNYPKCIERKEEIIFSKNGERKNALLYILTASNQKGKKG